jgi:Lrp/AsnC family transcriptional regulator for asnA, asnC and gidA
LEKAIMDELDQKILNELQSHGFQKSTILAGHLGVAERTIRRRINAMKSKGFIRIIAVPNPILSGNRAWAKVGIKLEAGSLLAVAHELLEHPSIYFVACSLGMFDIMIAVHFDTMDKLTYFVNSELTKVKGISSTETMILTSPRKYYNFSWPEPYYDTIRSSKVYQVSDIDRGIINVLKEDALIPVKVLKSRLGIGESTIHKHIKKMLKEGVFKIEVVPSLQSMEYQVWATMGLTIRYQSAHKVISAIVKNPAVYLASVSLGRFNIIIAARFPNIDLLNEFIHIELLQITGVSAIEAFIHTKPLKYHSIMVSDSTLESL